MDPATTRILMEVAKESGVDQAFLARIVAMEEEKAHLGHRQGLFVEMEELSRREANRRVANSGSAADENR